MTWLLAIMLLLQLALVLLGVVKILMLRGASRAVRSADSRDATTHASIQGLANLVAELVTQQAALAKYNHDAVHEFRDVVNQLVLKSEVQHQLVLQNLNGLHLRLQAISPEPVSAAGP
jgi:hypothetical protein